MKRHILPALFLACGSAPAFAAEEASLPSVKTIQAACFNFYSQNVFAPLVSADAKVHLTYNEATSGLAAYSTKCAELIKADAVQVRYKAEAFPLFKSAYDKLGEFGNMPEARTLANSLIALSHGPAEVASIAGQSNFNLTALHDSSSKCSAAFKEYDKKEEAAKAALSEKLRNSCPGINSWTGAKTN
jgi:hypothetical protein